MSSVGVAGHDGFLRRAFDSIQDGISILDRDRRIVMVNCWIADRHGAESEILGRRCFEVYQNRTTVCPWCPVTEAECTGCAASADVHVPLPDGGSYWTQLSAHPIYDESGALNGFVEHVKDVTDRVAAEQQLRKAVEERELLLNEGRHRMKNDLMLIRSLLSLQAASAASSDAAQTLHEAAERVGVIAGIYEMLSGSADEACPAASLVRRLVAALSAAATASGISLQVACDEFEIDSKLAVAIGIATNELVTNTIKYASAGQADPRIDVDVRHASDGMVTLTVRDNGPGVPTDVHDGSRRGLGLTITQALAEQHGGTVTLESDHGTVATVTFAG